MKKLVDQGLILITLCSPLVGVLWFGWVIPEVVFVYTIEAAALFIYYAVALWQTHRKVAAHHPEDVQAWHAGMSLLRLGMEAFLILGAATFLIDAALGHRSSVFDDSSILGEYFLATLVPVGSIVLHYGSKVFVLLKKKEYSSQPLAPMWIWIIQLPLPLFVSAYLLVAPNRPILITLLLVVGSLRALVEYLQSRPVVSASLVESQLDLNVLISSSYSARAILSQVYIYLLVLIGFLAVNPFTQDERYSPTQNALIFLGCVCIAAPLLYRPKVTLKLDTLNHAIIAERGGLWPRVKTIPIADVKRVQAQRNERRVVHTYLFTLQNGQTWKCRNLSFNIEQWKAWLQHINKVYPALNIPPA